MIIVVLLMLILAILVAVGEVIFERDWPRFTWKYVAWLAIILGMCASADAAIFRVDPSPVMTTAGVAPPYGSPALYAVASATIQLCTDPACSAPATTYTDASGATTCPSYAPVVPAGTIVCTSVTGPQGQFGFWIAPGTYYYKIILQNGTTLGNYPITSNTAGVTSLTAGTGISVSASIGSVTVSNTGIITVTAGTGLASTGGQNPTLSNTGILSLTAGLGVSVTSGQNPTVTNTGVTSFNTRAGDVVPATDDYTYSQIGGTVQGNTTVPQMASTNSGVAGATLCDDASGNSTTVGCTASLPASGPQLSQLRIQPNTGNNTTLQFSGPPEVYAADYDFPAQTCDASLVCVAGGSSGGVLGSGNNSLTMTPVPLGVNGSDPYSAGVKGHYVYVSGGTGTAEACYVNGGSGTQGQTSGVIIINCANTHSGAFTIASATGGTAEATQQLATLFGYGTVRLSLSVPSWHGPLFFQVPLGGAVSGQLGHRYRLTGESSGASIISVAADFPLSSPCVLCTINTSNSFSMLGPEIDHLKVSAPQPDSTNLATYTHWPWIISSNDSSKTNIHDVILFGWNGIQLLQQGRSVVRDSILTMYNIGINTDGNADSMYFDNVQMYPVDATQNQVTAYSTCTNTSIIGMTLGRNDDLHITNSFFITPIALSAAYSSAETATGTTNGIIANTDFDTCAVVNVSDGVLLFTGNTGGTISPSWMNLTGGTVTLKSNYLGPVVATGPFINAMFTNASTHTGLNLNVAANTFHGASPDAPIIQIGDNSGAAISQTTIEANTLFRAYGIVYTTPIINDLTTNVLSQVTVIGNDAFDPYTGNVFMVVTADGSKSIKSNYIGLNTLTLPASCPCFGEYEQTNMRFDQQIENLAYGGAVASATTIAIPQKNAPTATAQYYYKQIAISGTAAIATLTVPTGITGMRLDVVATGNWTTTTGGNFANTAFTAVSGTYYLFSYINGKWYIN